MKIAVTYANGQVFQHFGHTQEFKVYEVNDKTVGKSEIVPTNGNGHGALVGFLSGLGVEVLLCGGLGGGARTALSEAGIKVYPGVEGDADAAVKAFAEGSLTYDPDKQCEHHEEQHGHGCGENHHGCGGNH